MNNLLGKLPVIFLILFTFTFANCGTTSKIKPIAQVKNVNISHYDRVVVQDFVDKATEKVKKAKKREAMKEEMKRVVRNFSDFIVGEIKLKKNFLEVSRDGFIDDRTLLIGGAVTRYKKGNAALKLLVGFGSGSSHFDATVEFKDGATGRLLGSVDVDKNSWAMGGALATAQTPETFMEGSAKKIADYLYKMRPYTPAPRTQYSTGYEYQEGGNNTQQQTTDSYNQKY